MQEVALNRNCSNDTNPCFLWSLADEPIRNNDMSQFSTWYERESPATSYNSVSHHVVHYFVRLPQSFPLITPPQATIRQVYIFLSPSCGPPRGAEPPRLTSFRNERENKPLSIRNYAALCTYFFLGLYLPGFVTSRDNAINGWSTEQRWIF